MSTYSLSPLYQPQYVNNSAATALVFSPTVGGGTAVPVGFKYQLSVLRVANNSAGPANFTLWRVPSGGAQGVTTLVIAQITIPVGVLATPAVDLTPWLGSMVLAAGDSIWALADTASVLVIHGDGLAIQG
jgi:hypothetical protein